MSAFAALSRQQSREEGFLQSEYVNRFLQIYVHLRIILKAEIKRKIFA